MPRKPRISEEDAKLFRDAVADSAPLRKTPEPLDTGTQKRPAPRPRKPAPLRDRAQASPEYALEVTPVSAEEALHFSRSGLQHGLLRQLQRGQLSIAGTLDLHGLTANEASRILDRFLEAGVSERRRCVLVIHGKGHGSRNDYPVLKSQVNRWLRDCSHVLAFCSAQAADGGTGAVYVLLKTRR